MRLNLTESESLLALTELHMATLKENMKVLGLKRQVTTSGHIDVAESSRPDAEVTGCWPAIETLVEGNGVMTH